MTTYEGSCQCGAVSFSFEGEIKGGLACNCSRCRRLGSLLAFGAADALTVKAEPEALGVYTFNKNAIEHSFCKTCGVATHMRGETPRGRMSAVNVRCIPAIDLDTLPITHVDGASF